MKLNFLKYNTQSHLRNNNASRANLPYKQAASIGVIFSVEDKAKHDDVKEFVRRLELDGKTVNVMSFLPKGKDNYGFLFDFFTEKDLNFWGSITSETALRFADTTFDFLYYLDVDPNPIVLNVIARSKAKCRVGKFFEEGKPFFELMLEVTNGTRDLIDTIYKYTSNLK